MTQGREVEIGRVLGWAIRFDFEVPEIGRLIQSFQSLWVHARKREPLQAHWRVIPAEREGRPPSAHPGVPGVSPATSLKGVATGSVADSTERRMCQAGGLRARSGRGQPLREEGSFSDASESVGTWMLSPDGLTR